MSDSECYEKPLQRIEEQLRAHIFDLRRPDSPFSELGEHRLTERLRVACELLADTRAAIRLTLRGDKSYAPYLKESNDEN